MKDESPCRTGADRGWFWLLEVVTVNHACDGTLSASEVFEVGVVLAALFGPPVGIGCGDAVMVRVDALDGAQAALQFAVGGEFVGGGHGMRAEESPCRTEADRGWFWFWGEIKTADRFARDHWGG